MIEGGVTGYGRWKVGPKKTIGRWEVLEFWTRKWEAYILLVSSGMWEDLFQTDFYQCTDIKLTKLNNASVNKA